MENKISIIVPTYNCEDTLEKCLFSIQDQSYRDFEVIIVDDGSTDNTKFLCKFFTDHDKRFIYFYKQNDGVSVARNFGIKLCTGKYITFVDSDDYIARDHLKNLILPFLNMKVDLTISALKYETVKGKELLTTKAVSQSFSGSEALLNTFRVKGIEGIVANKLFKRKLIEAHGIFFDEEINKYEDHLFCCHYLTFCKEVFFNGEETYHYIKHKKSTLQSLEKFGFQDDIGAYEKMKEYVIRSDFGKISEIMNLIHFAEISIAVNFFSKASSVEEKKKAKVYLINNLTLKNVFSCETFRGFVKALYSYVNVSFFRYVKRS